MTSEIECELKNLNVAEIPCSYTVTDEMLQNSSVECSKLEKLGLSSESQNNLQCLSILSVIMDATGSFEDLLIIMKKLIKLYKGNLNERQINFLYSVYKNMINTQRTSLKSGCLNKNPSEVEKVFQLNLQRFLQDACLDAVLTCRYIMERIKGKEPQRMLLCHKMIADYLRYWAEIEMSMSSNPSEVENLEYVKQAAHHYEEAAEYTKYLDENYYYLKLGVALNRSVFMYEICGQMDEAFEMAKEHVCECEKRMELLENTEDWDKAETTAVLQLLKENVRIWTEISAILNKVVPPEEIACESAEPAVPPENVEPGESSELAESVEPAKNVEEVEAAEPDKSVEPVEPPESVESVESTI